VFLACLGLGILVGLIKLVAPDYASVELNGEQVTGVAALVTAAAIGAVLGLIFGLIIAGIVKLATRGRKKAA
jgi:predicted DNA repair protein MutK